MIERLEWAKMALDGELADETEKLTASKEFNDALEFSMVAREISDDDTLAGVRHTPEDSPQMRRQATRRR